MVRGAKVKTDSRYLGGIIERPLQKLFPLEMGREEKKNENANDEEAETSTDQPDPSNMALATPWGAENIKLGVGGGNNKLSRQSWGAGPKRLKESRQNAIFC